MKKLRPRSFFKGGSPERSVVVGAPANFDFLGALRDATSIKAAIAFGHMSGWKRVKLALTRSRAESIQVLLGQSFLQTEPDVLDSLCGLESAHFLSKLAPSQPTFHPKVWIVESRQNSFVIVGSANLSNGGFADNTECSAYLRSREAVEALNSWFSLLWKQGSFLKPELCEIYRNKYLKVADARLAAKSAIQRATQELATLERAWRREEAIEQVREYFKTKNNIDSGKRRIAAMAAIRKCLKPPQFSFDKDDWREFRRIHEFGSMKRIKRNTEQYLPQLKKAFTYLADDSKPLAARVDAVVLDQGRYHVPGVGMNIATKVLAMLSPNERAVYNERVAKTLRAFGYNASGGTSKGELYARFCQDMKAFIEDCELSEMLSIDSFFEHYSRPGEKPNR